MSSRFNPTRTNRTPWTDKIDLITQTITIDADGYETKVETTRSIFCTFSDGINRSEFYDGMKAGIRLSAQVECWSNDFSGEKYCTFNNVRYKIVRSYETGRGTIELSLSEEVR